MNSIKKEDIQRIDLVDFLSRQGLQPVKSLRNSKFGEALLYYSPFRNEQHPSLEVFPQANRWIDRAEMSQTGDIVELVSRLLQIPNTRDNFNLLLKETYQAYGGSIIDLPPREYKPIQNEGKQRIAINKISTIWYDSLIDYLNRRCISVSTARMFCKQVHYSQIKDDGTTTKERVDIGFPNNHNGNNFHKADVNGGWELRMESLPKTMPDGNVFQYKSKICNAKEPSYIMGEGSHRSINIFEGFFDMLSCVEQKIRLRKNPFDEDYIVLNSVSLADKVLKHLDDLDLKNRQIKLFLDNDSAGTKTTEKIVEALQDKVFMIKDFRYVFEGFKDLNEWHIAETQKQLMKQEQQQEKQPVIPSTPQKKKGMSI